MGGAGGCLLRRLRPQMLLNCPPLLLQKQGRGGVHKRGAQLANKGGRAHSGREARGVPNGICASLRRRAIAAVVHCLGRAGGAGEESGQHGTEGGRQGRGSKAE